MLLIVPSDPGNCRSPEPHFRREVEAWRALGHETAVLDYDTLRQHGASRAAESISVHKTAALYRGWMMTGETYFSLYHSLRARDVYLTTAPDAYREAHELPGWYETFRGYTSRSLWVPKTVTPAKVHSALELLGSRQVVIRDYSKSEKAYWDTAMFIPDSKDKQEVERVLNCFLALRGTDLEGGVVLREYEHYSAPEVRTWWHRGRLMLITPHPDDPDASIPPLSIPSGLVSSVRQLRSPFVSVDLARLSGRDWMVVEVGDGQVSGLPSSVPAERLLAACLK